MALARALRYAMNGDKEWEKDIMQEFHATTVLSVRKGGQVALGGDGQVTLGDTIMKGTATKVRRLADGEVLAGFAGAVADAFALFDRFEGKLKEYNKNLLRSAVELAKEWRTDKYLRQLNAMLAVCDAEKSLLISGTGEIIEPDDGIIAIGSGGPYALAAARALTKHANLDAATIVRESLAVAAEICIYTNTHFTVEMLEPQGVDGHL
jgi:ATP-dependent HslUV protease subunit HslV